jgi:hypothetical protein
MSTRVRIRTRHPDDNSAFMAMMPTRVHSLVRS